MDDLYPGTPLSFLPEIVSDAWRVVLWVGIMLTVSRMAWRAIQPQRTPAVILYGRASLAVFLLGAAVIDAQRWGHPVTWENTGVATVGLILAHLAMQAERPEVDR